MLRCVVTQQFASYSGHLAQARAKFVTGKFAGDVESPISYISTV